MAEILVGLLDIVRDQVAQRLDQQAVLALEVEVDDADAEPGRLGHVRQGQVGEAACGDAVDGGFHQLDPSCFLESIPRHGGMSYTFGGGKAIKGRR